jgi:hypothetical protein
LLGQVRAHHLGLDPDAAHHDVLLDGVTGARGAHRVGLDQLEDRRVGDEAALHRLGQTRPVVVVGQRVQHVEVAQDAGRRMERADQVLAVVGVDAGLPANGGVQHAGQRRGQLDDPDAAQPGRGHPTGQVGGRTTAQAQHRVRRVRPSRPSTSQQ